ncbi:hypothetical protein TW85_23075 [Marinomonas sp. S3726]|uniref:hypothetical protein n=1 Tax=Marinomonas sp. S3726 TaxID=579484 RepID=UPI0005FA9212|nr:hypothetical protein [Marinomonas sp. S3726]KJZ08918.1 hypothetical protein TW85_23075 [Marinomonas sp. S3726]
MFDETNIFTLENAAVLFTLVLFFLFFMMIVNVIRFSLASSKFKKYTKEKLQLNQKENRREKVYFYENESFIYLKFLLKRKFLDSSDKSYIEAGNKSFRLYLIFVFNVFLFMVAFITFVILFGEYIHNLK